MVPIKELMQSNERRLATLRRELQQIEFEGVQMRHDGKFDRTHQFIARMKESIGDREEVARVYARKLAERHWPVRGAVENQNAD